MGINRRDFLATASAAGLLAATGKKTNAKQRTEPSAGSGPVRALGDVDVYMTSKDYEVRLSQIDTVSRAAASRVRKPNDRTYCVSGRASIF